MLTRMDKDVPVETHEDFCRNLRHAFAAKNSLSRIQGYTPEQCLLGKARALPGSLTSDDDASSHVLADSNSPEGQKFRDSLYRRECARKAFIQADNDSAFRRALLRRNRPGILEFEAGDWVLYWRMNKGNIRGERGRWFGPAQVVAVEQKKVVWLSHLGRIIRASPEQLRPASLREYQKLPRDDSGNVLDEHPEGRGYLELEDIPDDGSSGYSPSVAADDAGSNQDGISQPETEIFPPDSGNSNASELPMDPVEVPVPVDDDLEEDDELCVFGDDVVAKQEVSGVWEISLCEMSQDFQDEQSTQFQTDTLVEHVLLASTARKQKIEVQYRTLNDRDRTLFDAAKKKEIRAWLDHGTVQKVAKGSLKDDQILRCRWILSWKAPEFEGGERRAKARLVVLGFEDPGLSENFGMLLPYRRMVSSCCCK